MDRLVYSKIMMLMFVSLLLTIFSVFSSSVKRPRFVLGEPARRHPGVYFGGIKPSGRVIEAYSDDLKVEHGQDIIVDLMEQIVSDVENEKYLPSINFTGHQITPFGNLTLGEPIYRGSRAIIFPLMEFPDKLIKYQCDCLEVKATWSSFHPLLKDWIHGNKAARLNLAVKTFFVSPASVLCDKKSGVCNFSMDDPSYDICKASQGTIRYSIMEKSNGITLDRSKLIQHGRILQLKDALSVGIELIEILRLLHTEARIVHGDIHVRNVMIEEAGMRFIDFERSSSNIFKPEKPRNPCGVFFGITCTQWQIDGFYPAARDDVMKAVQVVAELMNPYSYYLFGNKLAAQGYARMRSFKLEENIFVFPGFDPIDNLNITRKTKDAIRYELALVLDLARAMNNINSIPPYRLIIRGFQNCLNLIR